MAPTRSSWCKCAGKRWGLLRRKFLLNGAHSKWPLWVERGAEPTDNYVFLSKEFMAQQQRTGAISYHNLSPCTALYLPPLTPHQVTALGDEVSVHLTFARILSARNDMPPALQIANANALMHKWPSIVNSYKKRELLIAKAQASGADDISRPRVAPFGRGRPPMMLPDGGHKWIKTIAGGKYTCSACHVKAETARRAVPLTLCTGQPPARGRRANVKK